jgi:hypothetical protein
LALGGDLGAVLGQGVRLRLPERHEVVTVLTCPAADGRTGFYWVRRS